MTGTYNTHSIHKYDAARLLRPACQSGIGWTRSSGALVDEIGERGALDRLERPEMVQQGALARGTDAGDFLQPGLADIAPATNAVRPYCESMRFVTQPLHEIQHRI